MGSYQGEVSMPFAGQHDQSGSQFEITALLDPQDIEALRLELRRLAKECGAKIRDFHVRTEFQGGALPVNPIEEPAGGAWADERDGAHSSSASRSWHGSEERAEGKRHGQNSFGR